MLLEDKVEPLAREIAHFLGLSGIFYGSSWKGYKRDEDLRPLKRQTDEDVAFVRTKNYQARVQFKGIREQQPEPGSIVVHPEIVLKSRQKYGASVTIDNYRSGSPSGKKYLEVEFADGETEAEALSGAFSTEVWAINKQSVSAQVEAGPASAEARAESEQGFRTTLEAAWNKQTGRTRDTRVSFHSEEFAPPWTLLEQRLMWTEQTKQRRVECAARIDCRVEIGRRIAIRKKGWRWTTRSPLVWESIDHLIAVAEKRGSVKHDGYEHFSRLRLGKSSLDSLARIKELRQIKVDRLTEPYPGNANIRVQIIAQKVNDKHEEDDD